MAVTANSTIFTLTRYQPVTRCDVEQTIREEDMSMASSLKQAQIHPVSPKRGAYVRAIPQDGADRSPLMRFEQWVGEEEFTTYNEDDKHKAAEFEALTPAVYGFGYERATGVPPGEYAGRVLSIVGWRSIEAVVRLGDTHHNSVFPANWVAALAPMLNPATESPEEAVVRLMREKDMVEFSLRARMVAEGVRRSWCPEFDPILDSTGLAPRQAKGWIEGTARFRAEVVGYDLEDPAVLEQIKENPHSFIPVEGYKIETLNVEPGLNAPLLST